MQNHAKIRNRISSKNNPKPAASQNHLKKIEAARNIKRNIAMSN